VFEFCGCYFNGQTCLQYRDIPTMGGDTLAQRYEETMVWNRLKMLATKSKCIGNANLTRRFCPCTRNEKPSPYSTESSKHPRRSVRGLSNRGHESPLQDW
jgi:hypothetical protein